MLISGTIPRHCTIFCTRIIDINDMCNSETGVVREHGIQNNGEQRDNKTWNDAQFQVN